MGLPPYPQGWRTGRRPALPTSPGVNKALSRVTSLCLPGARRASLPGSVLWCSYSGVWVPLATEVPCAWWGAGTDRQSPAHGHARGGTPAPQLACPTQPNPSPPSVDTKLGSPHGTAFRAPRSQILPPAKPDRSRAAFILLSHLPRWKSPGTVPGQMGPDLQLWPRRASVSAALPCPNHQSAQFQVPTSLGLSVGVSFGP